MNGLISLDVTSCSWSVVPTKGDVPLPRSYHAASRYQNLMLVHGGESKSTQENGHVTFAETDSVAAATEQSLAEDSSRSVPHTQQSQSTSVLLDQYDNSRDIGRRPDTLQKLPPSISAGGPVGHDGVTLGDSLCGTKLANQVKVSAHYNKWVYSNLSHNFLVVCLYSSSN